MTYNWDDLLNSDYYSLAMEADRLYEEAQYASTPDEYEEAMERYEKAITKWIDANS